MKLGPVDMLKDRAEFCFAWSKLVSVGLKRLVTNKMKEAIVNLCSSY